MIHFECSPNFIRAGGGYLRPIFTLILLKTINKIKKMGGLKVKITLNFEIGENKFNSPGWGNKGDRALLEKRGIGGRGAGEQKAERAKVVRAGERGRDGACGGLRWGKEEGLRVGPGGAQGGAGGGARELVYVGPKKPEKMTRISSNISQKRVEITKKNAITIEERW